MIGGNTTSMAGGEGDMVGTEGSSNRLVYVNCSGVGDSLPQCLKPDAHGGPKATRSRTCAEIV